MSAPPIYSRVDGAPYQPGEAVVVMDIIDSTVDDVGRWIGEQGRVEYLEYCCGCGQEYPSDPMIGVRFADGALQEFWREEIAVLIVG